MKHIKRYNSWEKIDEGWKDWVVALGLVTSSFLTTDALAQSSLKDKLKDRLENVMSDNSTLKKLKNEGYYPGTGDRIDSDRKLSDSGHESLANTKTSARTDLIEKLKSKGIIDLSIQKGIILYKNEGNNTRAKWIAYL